MLTDYGKVHTSVSYLAVNYSNLLCVLCVLCISSALPRTNETQGTCSQNECKIIQMYCLLAFCFAFVFGHI